jgi:hypothetical protein
MNANEWNDLLFKAVFATTHDQKPVRIINATDGFLAQVLGSAEDSGAAARQDFVNAYRNFAYGIRRLFDYDLQVAIWRNSQGHHHPTFFGQLYLSLLAASATEDTYREGDFRRRYCLLLGLPEGN